tara:strand:- start:2597 stop:3208 length:612 start_codon:yes stop_codon:yes gene_type:complete
MRNDSTIKLIFDEMFKTKMLKEANITTHILFAFIFIAIFSKLIFSGIQTNDMYGSHGPASIDIMSYIIILISIVSIIFLNTMINDGANNNNVNIISFDMVILVSYLLWLIYINMRHFKRLNMRKVPSQYFIYSNLTIYVIAAQSLFFAVQYILLNDVYTNGIIDENKDFFTRLNFINYIFMFLNFLLILIQQIILEYFSVDII